MKIFFGDLVHTWDKKSIWTFPLNVGYVASYAKKYLDKVGINCDIKIFKDPLKMINDIKKEKPHAPTLLIVGNVVKLRDKLSWYKTN